MTNDGVHSAVVRWIKAKTGATTIKAHQSGPTPALPYVMVNDTGTAEVRRWHQKMEYTETDAENSAGEKIVTAAPMIEMEWRFSVHAYGPSPTDRLRPIVSAMKVPQAMEPLMPGLHVHEVSAIRDVPDWINNAWQPRAQMDIIVRGIIRDSVGEVDVIDEYSFEIARAE
jgi:hypothetical protein